MHRRGCHILKNNAALLENIEMSGMQLYFCFMNINRKIHKACMLEECGREGGTKKGGGRKLE